MPPLDGQDELAGFVRRHIRSVWTLELLLLLRRDPARRWTSPQLVTELRASTKLVTDILDQLLASGLVAPEDDGFRYAPALPMLDQLCANLQEAYRERPVSIINLITRPDDPVRSLADAFKFKKRDR